MIAVVEIIELLEDDLIGTPIPHTLATGKSVVIFNLKINSKTSALKTGNVFEYADDGYEVMNTFRVQAASDYLKFNCVRKNRLV